MTQLHEKYRPQTWKDVRGQKPAMRRLQCLAKRKNLTGRAYWLSGPSGTGKTTIARLIGREVADESNIEEIDATDLSAAAIRELEKGSYCRRLGSRPGLAIIINEAHGLNKAAVRQLLTTLERIPGHVVWIFTTTTEGQQSLFAGIDAHPLLSRCVNLPMQSGEKLTHSFAAHALEIARSEQLDGQPMAAYVELMEHCQNNLRAALTEIESGAMLA